MSCEPVDLLHRADRVLGREPRPRESRGCSFQLPGDGVADDLYGSVAGESVAGSVRFVYRQRR
jgi:hypothetical protein